MKRMQHPVMDKQRSRYNQGAGVRCGEQASSSEEEA